MQKIRIINNDDFNMVRALHIEDSLVIDFGLIQEGEITNLAHSILGIIQYIKSKKSEVNISVKLPSSLQSNVGLLDSIKLLGVQDISFADDFDSILDWLGDQPQADLDLLQPQIPAISQDELPDLGLVLNNKLQPQLQSQSQPQPQLDYVQYAKLESNQSVEIEVNNQKQNDLPKLDIDSITAGLNDQLARLGNPVRPTQPFQLQQPLQQPLQQLYSSKQYYGTIFYNSKGGVGATTILLHMLEIYQKKRVKVGVIDFDSHIPVYKNLPLSMYANDILQNKNEYSSEEWSRMTVNNKGIEYFLQPNINMLFTPELVDKIIRNMQRVSSNILIDMNYRMDIDAQVMAFSVVPKIYWVLDMTKVAINSIIKQKVKFRERGFNDFNKINYIVNRVHKADIGIEEIESLVGGKVVVSIPEMDDVILRMNKGEASTNLVEKLLKLS